MVSLELWLAGAILVSLIVYALSAGADFGGGVWDLLATGPRARAQRETIAHALAPIWEANHVWLIIVVVLLFVAFPKAFAAITTALHVPLSLMLVGIVLRGSAFVFRTYDIQADEVQRRWSLMFAIASVLTPIMLGVSVGALASGAIRVDPATGQMRTDFFSPWLAPFPWALGLFTLTLFAFIAAVYLTHESVDPELQGDFRRRALAAGVAVGVMAWLTFLTADAGAPLIREGLSRRWWSLPFHLLTAAVALGALGSLWAWRLHLARVLAMAQISLILLGWGLAQFPYLIVPDLTFANTAAPASVLRALLGALVLGAIVLVPSFWYLYAVFKGARTSA